MDGEEPEGRKRGGIIKNTKKPKSKLYFAKNIHQMRAELARKA
jgi:hypothetical protein